MGISKAFILALAITITLGILDEIRQMYVPGRGYEIKDIILDSYGALIGSSLFLLTKINQFIYVKIRRRFRSDAIPQGGSYGR
jgi:VanZ family protein